MRCDLTREALIRHCERQRFPPVPDAFMPEMWTEVCAVTGDELRGAKTTTIDGAEISGWYLLSAPESMQMRDLQAERDQALRVHVWVLKCNQERYDRALAAEGAA